MGHGSAAQRMSGGVGLLLFTVGRLAPVPRQQFMEARVRMVTDSAEHIGEPSFGIDVVKLSRGDQSIHGCCPLATTVRAAEGPVFSSDGNAAQRALRGIIGQADFAIGQEADKGGPTVEHVIHGFGDFVVSRQPSAFGAHPGFQRLDLRFDILLAQLQAFGLRQTDEWTLQIKDGVDPPHRFKGQRRESGRFLFRTCECGLVNIRQDKEFPSTMAPTGGLDDGAWLSTSIIKLVVPGISIGLENPEGFPIPRTTNTMVAPSGMRGVSGNPD